MENDIQDFDDEITAIATISSALAMVKEPDARQRVLSYILARYGPQLPADNPALARSRTDHSPLSALALSAGPPFGGSSESRTSPLDQVTAAPKELPGIARISDSGDLKITVRDLKAKSGLDAAVRLAHVAIYAYDHLTGGQPFSSRKGLTPLLQQWRLYDGNARARLASHRGIMRSGDNLTLDAHARRDAERFIEEILSDEVPGQWRPK